MQSEYAARSIARNDTPKHKVEMGPDWKRTVTQIARWQRQAYRIRISLSLSTTEKKYAQLEKEALSLVFGISKFHKYLHGRDFVLQTDHLPLIGLLKEDRAISAMASARIQRWALTLSKYQYHLEYRPGTSICHADGLSRLPLTDTPGRVHVPEEVVLALTTMNDTPITAEHIARWRQPIR